MPEEISDMTPFLLLDGLLGRKPGYEATLLVGKFTRYRHAAAGTEALRGGGFGGSRVLAVGVWLLPRQLRARSCRD